MKSHIVGSSEGSKANTYASMENAEMQQVVALWRLCSVIALNQEFGFGNERLKRFNDAVGDVLSVLDRYSSSTGVSRAKGYKDLDTGIEKIMQIVNSRNIDIGYTLGIKALEV